MFLDDHESVAALFGTAYLLYPPRAFKLLIVRILAYIMWIIKPAARMGTIIPTIGRAIISQAALNVSGLKTEMIFMDICNVRKSMRNNPVMLIISFFPIDDVNIFAILY